MLIPLLVPGEDSSYSESVVGSLLAGTKLIVPTFCMLEFSNAVLTCVRSGRMTSPEASMAHDRVGQLPIEFVDGLSFLEMTAIHRLTFSSGLTFYDGASLMLAMKIGARLATLDQNLRRAAVGQGVKIFE